jgi:heat shock protein beta-11
MEIVFATSSDARHPPDHILDGKESTFWCSTGMYPQELVIAFSATRRVGKIRTTTSGVRKLVIERAEEAAPSKYAKIVDAVLDPVEGAPQREVYNIAAKPMARYLRFSITAGHEDFVRVFKIEVEDA